MPDFTELDRMISRADPAATLPPPTVIPDPLVAPSRRPTAGRSHPRLAVAGSVLAVVAAIAVVLLIAPFTAPSGSVPSGAGRAVLTTPPPSGATGSPSGDHTASAGPDFQRARRLLATLRTAVPDGYTLPPMPTGDPRDDPGPTSGPDGGVPPASFEAYWSHRMVPGWSQDWTGWQYGGDTDLSRDGRTGSVGLRVWTRVPAVQGDLCSLLSNWYWIKGNCRMVQSGGKQVALSTADPHNARGGGGIGGFEDRADTWASYRYPDGTLVMIIQSRRDFPASTPSLTSPVYSESQLAALAVDPRFSS